MQEPGAVAGRQGGVGCQVRQEGGGLGEAPGVQRQAIDVVDVEALGGLLARGLEGLKEGPLLVAGELRQARQGAAQERGLGGVLLHLGALEGPLHQPLRRLVAPGGGDGAPGQGVVVDAGPQREHQALVGTLGVAEHVPVEGRRLDGRVHPLRARSAAGDVIERAGQAEAQPGDLELAAPLAELMVDAQAQRGHKGGGAELVAQVRREAIEGVLVGLVAKRVLEGLQALHRRAGQ